MSRHAQNYNTDDEYEKNMSKSYHSYHWKENKKKRSQFDLDLHQVYDMSKENSQKSPWDYFINVTKTNEKYEPCDGFRTEYDQEMQKNYGSRNSQDFNNVMSKENYSGPRSSNNRQHNHNK